MEQEFLTIRKLSGLLDMSEQVCYKLAREEAIPGRVKIGGSIRFNRVIVMDWLSKGGASQ